MEQADYLLAIDNKYYGLLEIKGFTDMLKDPSSCYKFYWLEAIVNLINRNVTETTMGDIIDEMIANAWYSVVEYHIHLSGFVRGEVVDGLERAINKLNEVSDLTSASSKDEIKQAIKMHSSAINLERKQLTNMVPYRALAGFFDNHGVKVNWEKHTSLIEYISYFDKTIVKLPYVFGEGNSLNRKVIFSPEWITMINCNSEEILGWIQFEKLKWLQNNNPEVPSLVYKLSRTGNERKLSKVRSLWEGVFECAEIHDIYTGRMIDSKNYDVDHFVPWSFVMNDELWNLIPMESSLNSSKNSNLPVWDSFFDGFAHNQYLLYSLIHEREGIHSLFEKCYKDNLHSIWAQRELYVGGNSEERFYSILSKNMRPVYDSAMRQGYSVWNRMTCSNSQEN